MNSVGRPHGRSRWTILAAESASFLESLQDAMRRLGDVWGHYLRRGSQPNRPSLILSGRSSHIDEGSSVREFRGRIGLGLSVKGADGREYALRVGILWDGEHWTISTEAWVDVGAEGQDILQQLPERTAVGLSDCMEQLGAAVGELVRFEDVVPEAGVRAEPDAAPDPDRM